MFSLWSATPTGIASSHESDGLLEELELTVLDSFTNLLVTGQKLSTESNNQFLRSEWEKAKNIYFEAKRVAGNRRAEKQGRATT